MAEEADQSRSEAPTLRRREEARQQGQVAVSSELTGGLLLLAGVGALWLLGPRMGSSLIESARAALASIRRSDFSVEQAVVVLTGAVRQGADLLGFFWGGVFAVAFGVGALQVGFHIVPGLIAPKWERLSPADGWDRIFSLAALVRGLAAALKVILVAAMAFVVMRGRLPFVALLADGGVESGAIQVWNMTLRLALAIAAALVLIGMVDYGYQRYRFEMSLRMSRYELKEEVKREEGDPLIKARIRRMHREAAKRRMMQEVPRATVVITNPTHLAVALRYDRATMKAPRVVAKGAGLVAQRLVELARRHAVPVVERKPIAQALFRAAKVGQDIPAGLYYAVAEVLAFIYKLRNAS
jgi:flagellar biosynthetic protein FlhB